MLPYDWEADPWNWLEQRSEHSCLRVNYSLVDGDHQYGQRRRPGLRLVRIEPGTVQDPLRCCLVLQDSNSLIVKGADEESNVPYEAVSYIWGSTDDLVPLRCKTDALEAEYSYSWIPITKNCAEVFRRLRLLNQTRYLWIDAISVDQADAADRAHYVRRMNHIYRNAERVVIILPNYKKPSGEYWAESKPGTWIFTHPYFTRIWILQEVFWGRNPVVYAGHHELQWSEVCSLYHTEPTGGISLSKETQNSVELVLAMGNSTANSVIRGNGRRSLLELHQLSKFFEATDQRDKLIALISMATDISPQMELILVDYTVEHDVLLRRYAAAICFRSLSIMPGVERGIDTSQRHGIHDGLLRCTNKIGKFMALSATESPDLVEILSSRDAEGYVWDVQGDDPVFRNDFVDRVREELSFRKPLISILVICQAILSARRLWTGWVEETRWFRGSQSREMTVSELLSTIEATKALVYASHSDDQVRKLLEKPLKMYSHYSRPIASCDAEKAGSEFLSLQGIKG